MARRKMRMRTTKTELTKMMIDGLGQKLAGLSHLFGLSFGAGCNNDSTSLISSSNSPSYCSATKSLTKSDRSPSGT